MPQGHVIGPEEQTQGRGDGARGACNRDEHVVRYALAEVHDGHRERDDFQRSEEVHKRVLQGAEAKGVLGHGYHERLHGGDVEVEEEDGEDAPRDGGVGHFLDELCTPLENTGCPRAVRVWRVSGWLGHDDENEGEQDHEHHGDEQAGRVARRDGQAQEREVGQTCERVHGGPEHETEWEAHAQDGHDGCAAAVGHGARHVGEGEGRVCAAHAREGPSGDDHPDGMPVPCARIEHISPRCQDDRHKVHVLVGDAVHKGAKKGLREEARGGEDGEGETKQVLHARGRVGVPPHLRDIGVEGGHDEAILHCVNERNEAQDAHRPLGVGQLRALAGRIRDRVHIIGASSNVDEGLAQSRAPPLRRCLVVHVYRGG
mmetsp:Transcript_28055/g.75570  ORF Transcript_28055/g.75570 Transcript_28055/m.75570 type:complete len:372 (-) Transcript_28055:11-1126(-)